MSAHCEYVRSYYGVPAEIGRAVIVNGKPGVITEDRGHHIGVTFDADEPGHVSPCHPTWEVVYGDMREIRPVPPVSRSKARYQRYLEDRDCFDNFRHFLAYETRQARERRYGR